MANGIAGIGRCQAGCRMTAGDAVCTVSPTHAGAVRVTPSLVVLVNPTAIAQVAIVGRDTIHIPPLGEHPVEVPPHSLRFWLPKGVLLVPLIR